MATYKFKYGAVETGYLIVASAKFTETTTSISKMVFVLQSNLTTFVLDDIVEFYDSTTTFKFKGNISSIGNNLGVYTIEVKDLGNVLTNTRFSNVYRNLSPEAIIQDIITTNTSLTFSNSITTSLTITKQVFKDELLIDSVTKMLELFNGAFSVDKNGVFTLIKKQGTTNINSISTISGDSLNGTWKTDGNKKFTKIIVEGANIDQQTTETFIGSFTTLTLVSIPKNVKVTNGSGTVLTQTTSNISGDYSVDEQAKTITFVVAQTNPVVDYTYQSQIKVELGNGATLKLQKPYIESENEALNLALSALTLYSNGIQTAKWLKLGGLDFENYRVGENLVVSDGNNNISGNFLINRIDYDYPNKLYLTVGENEDSLFNWQKETQQRIKELEQKNQNTNFITLFDYLAKSIKVNITSSIVSMSEKVYFADTFYLSNNPNDTRNQMLNNGTGPVMRNTGYDLNDLLSSGTLSLENGTDILVSEIGDVFITD